MTYLPKMKFEELERRNYSEARRSAICVSSSSSCVRWKQAKAAEIVASGVEETFEPLFHAIGALAFDQD